MKLTKYVVMINLIITSLLFTQCSSSDKDKIQKQLQTEVDGLNKNTPVQITSNMQFDSCALDSGSSLVYFFSITDSIAPDNSFFKNLELDVRDMTKKDPGLADIRNNQLSIKYNYRDISENLLYSFTIEPKDYQ